MTFSIIRLLVYGDTSIPLLNGLTAGGALSTSVMSPIMGVIGLCLLSLGILGFLWLKNRYLDPEYQRARYMDKSKEQHSIYDYVTGLPTRRLFGTMLEQALSRAAKNGRSVAL